MRFCNWIIWTLRFVSMLYVISIVVKICWLRVTVTFTSTGTKPRRFRGQKEGGRERFSNDKRENIEKALGRVRPKHMEHTKSTAIFDLYARACLIHSLARDVYVVSKVFCVCVAVVMYDYVLLYHNTRSLSVWFVSYECVFYVVFFVCFCVYHGNIKFSSILRYAFARSVLFTL